MDMIVRLLGESQQYAAAMGAGRSSTAQLNAQLDKLIVSMEAEAAGSMVAARQTQILALADQGASGSKAEYALRLADELESQKAVNAALEAETASKTRAKATAQSLIATITQEAKTYGMSASEIRLYTAAQQGATQADISKARAIEFATGTQQRFDREIQKQIRSQRAATAAASGQTRGTMILTESMRGLEDAVAGFTNNGLKGMAMATTNNVGQIGALMGNTAGLYLQIASVAALIGASLLPMLMKWANNTDEVRKKEEELEAASRKNHEKYMSRIEERARHSFTEKQSTKENTELRDDPETSAAALLREEKRLKDQIAADENRQYIERRKQEELQKRKMSLEERQRGDVGVGELAPEDRTKLKNEVKENEEAQRESAAAWKAAANDRADHARQLALTEEARKQKADKEGMLDGLKEQQAQNERTEKAAEKFQKERAEMERQSAAQLVDEDAAKKMKVMQQLGERQAQIDQWVSENRMSRAEGDKLKEQVKEAADREIGNVDAKVAATARNDQKTQLTEDIRKQKKELDDQTKEPGSKNLAAVEAKSSEGFKQIFDALGGSGGPQVSVAKNTALMVSLMKADVELKTKQLAALEKIKPIKTGGG